MVAIKYIAAARSHAATVLVPASVASPASGRVCQFMLTAVASTDCSHYSDHI